MDTTIDDKCVRPRNDGKCIKHKAKALAMAVLNSRRSKDTEELAYAVLEVTRSE